MPSPADDVFCEMLLTPLVPGAAWCLLPAAARLILNRKLCEVIKDWRPLVASAAVLHAPAACSTAPAQTKHKLQFYAAVIGISSLVN